MTDSDLTETWGVARLRYASRVMPRPRTTRKRALACACALATCAVVSEGSAQKPRAGNAAAAPSASAAQSDASAEAQRHFMKARDLYKAGQYREAIVELEAAVKLDPMGKELVYNLGVLHEKLGDIDEAMKYFRQYATMDLTQEERDKTEGALKRLEGAKRELDEKKKAAQPPPPPPVTPVTHNGRVDGMTIGAAALSGVGFVVGIVFAVKAESTKPPSSGFITGKDGSYADLQSRADTAHKNAIVADVGFGIGIAAGVGAALLYALRPKEAAQPPVTGRATVSAAPLPGGGAVLVGGSF